MNPRVLRYRVQPYRWPRTYDRIQHSNRPDLQKKQRKTKSQLINQNQIRRMQAHQHEQNCLQIDPAMNQTIYSTPKLSWASDHERKFNLHKVLQLNFFFSSTGRRPPDRTGLSESEVTRLFNLDQEIFQWMLARYCFSNSRCALSDSSYLHLKRHVLFFTRDWFFSLMQHALLSDF